MKESIKGRGAQIQVSNRFFEHSEEMRDDFLEFCFRENELPSNPKTQYIYTFPKTIVNKVTSPDVGMGYSLNPYQGCEHGCIYCYARNSHEYWGYGAGLDFEQKILVKKNAPALLEKKTTKSFLGSIYHCIVRKYRLLSTYRKEIENNQTVITVVFKV